MTAPDPAACAAPGCPRAPQRGLLCPWHHRVLGDTLADLAGDLAASAEPRLAGWRADRGGTGGVLASERDPVNLRMIDAQRDAPPVLAAWAAWLCQQRGLARPGGVQGDRKLLSFHLDWITAQPEVTDFWVQIRALWSALRGHLPVRRCTCGGPVWSDRGGGWCSWCAASWRGGELLRLPRPEAAA